MACQVSFPELAEQIGQVVRTVMDDIRPALVEAALSGNRGERANIRHADKTLLSVLVGPGRACRRRFLPPLRKLRA